MAGLAEDIRQDDFGGADDFGGTDDFDGTDDFGGQADDITDIETEAARLASASRRASADFASSRANRARAIRGWSALAACMALLVAGGYVFRVDLVKTFPSTASLYAELGLEVNIRGLEFQNLAFEQEFEQGVPVMSIKGEILNISDETKVLPRLRLSLLNKDNQEIYHWTLNVGKAPLEPSTRRSFSTRLASPPAHARNIQVRFAAIAR